MEFKKKYGQNFLIDKNITKKIASVISDKEDSLVIEIGCGDGKLTKELCFLYTNVIGYEIDLDLKNSLLKSISSFSNCEIIFDDILKRDIVSDIKRYKYKNLYIIANLPYYITTPIIEKIINLDINSKQMVLMVQKEVGDRFCAKPGTKEYNSLTVYLNYYFDLKKEFVVNRTCFMPKPNVDSIVVSFANKETKPYIKDKEIFFKLVRDSFTYKRKTLKNNLQNYDLDKILKVLAKYNLSLSVRAEQLSINIFIDIANNL